MESLLNLFWVAICAVAGVWWWKTCGCNLHGRQRVLHALALGMVLLLLFPVISLTDDLQAATALAESEHGIKSQGLLLPWDAAAALPLLLTGFFAVMLTVCGPRMRRPRRTAPLSRGFLRTVASRPPPAVFSLPA